MLTDDLKELSLKLAKLKNDYHERLLNDIGFEKLKAIYTSIKMLPNKIDYIISRSNN